MEAARRMESTSTVADSGRGLRVVPSLVSAVMGLNSNITVGGLPFHVQTEDLGSKKAQIVTHVFADGGRVVKVARVDYSKHLERPNLRAALPKAMKAHHSLVARKLQIGELDSVCALVTLGAPSEAAQGREPEGVRTRSIPEAAPISCVRASQKAVEAEPRSSAPVPARAAHSIPPSRIRNQLFQRTRTRPNQEPAGQLHRMGVEYLAAGANREALLYLTRAVQLEPMNESFRTSLQRCLEIF